MPAYNYFPATYQPNYYQNPYAQVPQQYQSQQIQTNGIIWVGSDSEADAYPIAPNNAVVMWNRSLPIVYIKQADASGRPTIKSYDLVERVKNDSDSATSAKGDAVQAYATKKEVKDAVDAIEAVKSDIKMLKKFMKRKEEEDNDDE